MLLAVARNWNGADAGKVELKALLRTYLEPALHLIRIAHFDTGGEQFLGALAERRVEFSTLRLGQQGFQLPFARLGSPRPGRGDRQEGP